MSAVAQKVVQDPEWVAPLMKDIDQKFKELMIKINSVSILRFQLDCGKHLDEEVKKPGYHIPECSTKSDLYDWEFPYPLQNLHFDKIAFRKHILTNVFEKYQTTDCFLMFRLSLIDQAGVQETASFKIKECIVCHVPA